MDGWIDRAVVNGRLNRGEER